METTPPPSEVSSAAQLGKRRFATCEKEQEAGSRRLIKASRGEATDQQGISDAKTQIYSLAKTMHPANSVLFRTKFKGLISILLRHHDVEAFNIMLQFEINLVEDLHILCEEALRSCTFPQLLRMFRPDTYDYLTSRLKENLIKRLMVESSKLPEQPDWLDRLDNIIYFLRCFRRGVLDKGEVEVLQNWLGAIPPTTQGLPGCFSNLVKFPDFPSFWIKLSPFFTELNQRNCRLLQEIFLEWPELDLKIPHTQLTGKQALLIYPTSMRVLLVHYFPQLSGPKMLDVNIVSTLKSTQLAYQEWLILLYLKQEKCYTEIPVLFPRILQAGHHLSYPDQINACCLSLRVIVGLHVQNAVPPNFDPQFRNLLQMARLALSGLVNSEKYLCYKLIVDLGKIAAIKPEWFRQERWDWTRFLISACTMANTVDRKLALLKSTAAIAKAAPHFFLTMDIFWIDLLTLTRLPFPLKVAFQAVEAFEILSQVCKKEFEITLAGGNVVPRLEQRQIRGKRLQ